MFARANKESQIGVEFLPDGVAIARVRAGRRNPGHILDSEFMPADGQQAQVEALKSWVREHNQQKTPCVCLVAGDDCDVYQVEKPHVEAAEMLQAVTWKVKDLIGYDVANAVVECYPMPLSSKNNQQQVGVVSARESVIASYVDSIRACGLNLVALDIHDLVRANLQVVRHSAEQTLAVLSLGHNSGLLSVYHDTDLYVSREFMIGLEQLEQAGGEDTEVYDSLLLEIQRSFDYFESYYGIGSVNSLRVFPQLPATEKMAMYLQNLASFDIDFIVFGADADSDGLEPRCFHAYCAAMRGVYA